MKKQQVLAILSRFSIIALIIDILIIPSDMYLVTTLLFFVFLFLSLDEVMLDKVFYRGTAVLLLLVPISLFFNLIGWSNKAAVWGLLFLLIHTIKVLKCMRAQ